MGRTIDKIRKYLYWGGILGALLLIDSRNFPESKTSIFERISGIILFLACFGTFLWNAWQVKNR